MSTQDDGAASHGTADPENPSDEPPAAAADAAPHSCVNASQAAQDDSSRCAWRSWLSGGSKSAEGTGRHVVCKLEYLTYRETKAMVLAIGLATMLGAAGVVWLLIVKLKNNWSFMRDSSLPIANIATCSACLTLLLPMGIWMATNCVRTWHQQWDGLRRRTVVSNVLLLLTMVLLLIFMLIPSVQILSERCWFLDPGSVPVNDWWTAQMAMWNTVFFLLVFQAHALNPVSHKVVGTLRTAYSKSARALRSSTRPSRGAQRGGVSDAGAGDGRAGNGRDVETGVEQARVQQRTVADSSLWHHLPEALIWVAVLVVLIVSNTGTGLEDIDLQTEALRDVDIQRMGLADDVVLEQRIFSVDNYLGAFKKAFKNSEPKWGQLAADPDVHMPRNVTLQTGSYGSGTAFLHLWGPLNSTASRNQWAFRDAMLQPDGLVLDQPEGINDGRWSCAALTLWQLDMARFVPFWYYCKAEASFDDAFAAIRSNQKAFRDYFNMAPCSEDPNSENDPSCQELRCPMPTDILAWDIVLNILMLLYFLCYLYYLSRAFRLLRERPYIAYRCANVLARLQMRESLVTFTFFFSSFTLLLYVQVDSCASQVVTGLGVAPLVFVGTVLAAVKAFYSCPRPHQPAVLLQGQLQQFAFREADAPALLAARGSPDEPLFVLETALKAMYYSITAYRAKKAAGPEQPYSLEAAMALDGLESHEIITDPEHDFGMIVLWGSGKIVLAFRGTVSMRNVWTDVSAMLKRHPHLKAPGQWLQPYVHIGFLGHWSTFQERVLALVRKVVEEAGPTGADILVTGHSMGGALATLAALDIARMLDEAGAAPLRLRCYTFGAPRVGNHAFAALYKHAVPDTWDVVNANDVVPKLTKWMRLYKRSGQRCFINPAGDVICRPSWIELNVNNHTLRSSVNDHLLVGYCASFTAAVMAQLSPSKALPQGRAGVVALARDDVGSVLLRQLLGLDVHAVARGEAGEGGQGKAEECQRGAMGAVGGAGKVLARGAMGPYVGKLAGLKQGCGGAFAEDVDITAGMGGTDDSGGKDSGMGQQFGGRP